MASRDISVVVATYDWAEALELVLAALAEQSEAPAEIIVADDGSDGRTAEVVSRWGARHVWQPNEGFRKARALDLAALDAKGDYLAFLDGDCIPRRSFVAAIRRAALPGWFLTTKRVNLRQDLSRQILSAQLPVWRWSALGWLTRAPHDVGRPGFLLPARDRRRPWRPGQPDFEAPGAAYCFMALDRADFERVNGYDTRATRWVDGEDQDLAIRLRRAGLRCGWPGPRSTVIHLWHPHRKEVGNARDRLYERTRAADHVEAVRGLRELAAERSYAMGR
jgi:glycosyltransferase involved in cell wall biosynthesis